MISPITCPGKWKSSNFASWKACHQQLWPDHNPPELLAPLSAHERRPDGQTRTGFFHEATVPTSYVLSALIHQASNPRTNQQFRAEASTALYYILETVLKTGTATVSWPGLGLEGQALPMTGAVSSELLLQALPVKAADRIQRQWQKDSEDTAVAE